MQPIQATYHDGVFSPTRPVEFTEGQEVTLWVDAGEEIAHLRDEDRDFLKTLVESRRKVFQKLAE